eukprot:17519_6
MRTSLLDSLARQREQHVEVLVRDRREWLVKKNKKWNKRVRFPQQSSPELIIIPVMSCIMPAMKVTSISMLLRLVFFSKICLSMRQSAVESAG